MGPPLHCKGTPLIFYVNGKKIVEENPDPEETLLTYLRRKLLLTGTKLSCGQGACGSCTVMVSRYDHTAKKIRHTAVVSCLVPVCSLHGQAVTTVEGVGSVHTKLHPVQEQLVKAHGTQCGYCTPGFVMSVYTLLHNNPKPSMEEVQKAIKGNLCRCTGYRPILDGFKPFTKDYCPLGDQCCKRTSSTESHDTLSEVVNPPCEPTQDLIFPSELQLSDTLDKQSLTFHSGSVTWMRPTSLKQLLYLKSVHCGSKIVSGNTTSGLERLHRDKHFPVLLCISHIVEMNKIVTMETGISIGAGVTLSTVEDYIQEILGKKANDDRYHGLEAFGHMLNEFAALQLKNMVTIGGCVASAWSNSDVTPLLCALGATVTLASSGKPPKSVVVDEHFFKGPGSTVIADDEVIVSVSIPFLNKNQYAYSIKESRRDFDTAIISTAACVTYDRESNTVKEIKVFLGNILPSVFYARNLSKGLEEKCCKMAIVSDALNYLQDDFAAIEKLGTKRLQANIKSLTEASVWKLMMKIMCDVHGEDIIPADERSAMYSLNRGYIESTQVYEEVPQDQPESDALRRPVIHRSAKQQATGEALYVDDTPRYENELYLSLVKSKYGHAHILDIDISEALKVVGVVDVITHKDIPGNNEYGFVVPDEVVFAVDEVKFCGQIIAAVVAVTQDIAEKAATLIDVTYEPLPCLTTIQEAIDANSYIDECKMYNCGDVQLGFEEADEIVQGEVEIGGQEHFYMETTVALVVPLKEDSQLEVFAPIQAAHLLQQTIASVLDIPQAKIGIHTKRIGGSFGGKESKFLVVLPVAVAAFRLMQPVRCVLDRNDDMQITGGRHPVLAKYKVGVKKSGMITALELMVYLNAGCTTDVSPLVLEVLLNNFDNCYRIPNVHLEGRLCKTNLPSNTAMRGFGNPQAVCIAETWMQHVAETLALDPVEVRQCNMYKPGDSLPFSGSSETYTSDRTWNEVMLKSNFCVRQKEIQEFNSTNKYRKRGIHVGAFKYGLHYSALFLYQATALVNIYLDGSVLIHHGGVEMGQGLTTKITQIASRVLGVSIENIRIGSTDTNIVPNAIVTGGSFTSLSNGAAVLDACEQLNERIKPYKERNPKGSMADWATAAYFDRVSLSATGFFKPELPNLGYDWSTGKGRFMAYYTSGACCSEVEVDIMTGQHVVRRVDIVMDVGRSLNPAIDIGQIEGGFLQGYGLYAMEELKFDNRGCLTTKNAMGYKIPCVINVPKQFNITLLKDSGNPYAVYSAKGIGEPPLLLANTVAFAIREAVKAYRKDMDHNEHFTLNFPVTPDQIRAVCPK